MNKPAKPPTVADELAEMDASHANLHAALIAAQAEIRAPTKDKEVEVTSRRTNSKYTFKYATMAAMVEALRPILTRHGLWFAQFVRDGAMVTRIMHRSGEYLDCAVPLPALPTAPQEAGSIITYFKRYSFSAAFALVAEDEDDANVAEGNEYKAKNGNITQAQFETLEALRERAGVSADRFCKRFQIDAIALLPADKFAEAKTALEAKIKEPA